MTQQQPQQSTPSGALRFNTETSKLEYYDGIDWVNITSSSADSNTGGNLTLLAGGLHPGGGASHILYHSADSKSNTEGFGSLSPSSMTHSMQAGASRTRAVFSGGYRNNICYKEFASKGNATAFGTLINWTYNSSQGYCSNNTRMLTCGGYNYGGSPAAWAGSNEITCITMATLGNNEDFGDISTAKWFLGGCGNSTRAIFGGGSPSGTFTVNYATKGDAADFGIMGGGVRYAAHSNATRGIFGGNSTSNSTSLYVTLSSFGRAADFGDLTVARGYIEMSGSHTRAIAYGGNTPTYQSVIDYYQISTLGDAQDFGDLNEARLRQAAASNTHGGL